MIRVLLLSSFAGSSRYIASLLPLLKESASAFLVAEGVGAEVLLKDGISIDCVIEADQKAVRDVFDAFIPDVIFVVPQFSDSVEEFAIQEARQRNIACIAGVDHWSLYKERFSKTDSDGNVISSGFEFLPDKVLVNDELAYQDSIDAGLPDKCLSIVGNPVLESRWKADDMAQFSKKAFAKPYGPQDKKRIILFISEPYSERLSVSNKHYPGFNEIDVLEDVFWAMSESEHLWIKPHPAESIDKFLSFVSNEGNCKLCIDESIDSLLLEADSIVGMGSMLLLEVALIRESVISYRPCEQVSFVGNRLGFTEKVTNKKDLQQALKNRSPLRENQLSHHYVDSAKNIVNKIVDSVVKK